MHSEPQVEHVVVVDDEPLILETACLILESAGYVTRAADSAERALQLIDDHTILVLTDTALGGMSGPDLRNTVRSTRPSMPVILMSGMEQDELHAWGVSPREGGFMSKPFEPDNLLAIVRDALSVEAL